jgi:hypothetical protein
MMSQGGAESVLCKVNLGEMLEIHLAGKATKKNQNSNTSSPPVYT